VSEFAMKPSLKAPSLLKRTAMVPCGINHFFSPLRSDSFRSGLMFYCRCLFFYSYARSLRCVGWLARNFAQWSIVDRIL